MSRQPRLTLDVQIAIIKEKLREVARSVTTLRREMEDDISRRQEILWNDYQQRLGREKLFTWWLGFLTVAVTAIGAFAALHR